MMSMPKRTKRVRRTLAEILGTLETTDRLPFGTVGLYLKQIQCSPSLLARWRAEYGRDGKTIRKQLYPRKK